MANQLSLALADAGLVSRQTVEKQAAQARKTNLRKQQKEQRDLCQIQEILTGLSPDQQSAKLRDGKKAFQQMNAKNL